MARFERQLRNVSRFLRHQGGGTAIIFALSVVPILLAAGAAIDYMRYSRAQTAMQAALDSGALAVAAAGKLPADQRIAAGEAAFARNMATAGLSAASFDADFKLSGNTVNAAARLELPTGLMQLAGISAMNVRVETEINIPKDRKAEIALVLDYSGSMREVSGGKVKYVAMREAAAKLIDDIAAAVPGKAKFALVPFSHHVYVTLPGAHVRGQDPASTWTGCTQDRRFPFNLTDATPTGDDRSKWGWPQAPVHASEGCAAYAPNHLRVQPLTSDFTALRDQLDRMRPYAWTHIALGAEFGYHLLSPNAPFSEGAAYGDNNVQKVMVLLTDGRQTEPAFGETVRNVRQGERNLEAICENAKASGITIVTLAFDLRGEADTTNRLKGCASDPDKHFFEAEDSAELAQAFEDIRRQITARVFISR